MGTAVSTYDFMSVATYDEGLHLRFDQLERCIRLQHGVNDITVDVRDLGLASIRNVVADLREMADDMERWNQGRAGWGRRQGTERMVGGEQLMPTDDYNYSYHTVTGENARVTFEAAQLVIVWDGNRHTFYVGGLDAAGAHELAVDMDDVAEDVFTWAVNKGIEEDRENTLNERDWTYL